MTEDHLLEREILIEARPEVVFAYFTDPGKIVLWLGRATLEPHPGGHLRIEINETRNPKWLDHYVSLKMSEIRVPSGGRALRFLCLEVGSDVILMVGCIKRGAIT